MGAEQHEEELHHRVARAEAVVERPRQRGEPGLEGDREAARVLGGDAVALRRLRHRLA
jgi:hypothetical protein